MSKKGIPENPFLSFDELIIKLKNKGLIIKQDTKLKWYFVSYNYQNIINSYNKPFLVNDSYKHYIKNANSQMIIDFFNFNRTISGFLINDLHTIEMQLSSAISYELMTIIGKYHKQRSSFISLSDEEIYQIFQCEDKYKIKKLYNELQKNFTELRGTKDYINKNWTNWKEVPLYSLCLIWTFGLSIKLFNNLQNNIKRNIIEKYFNNIKEVDIDIFTMLLFCFKDLRNKISHNECIYNFRFKPNKIKNKITKPSNKNIDKIKDKSVNVKLIQIIKIISKITNKKDLENLILKKLTKLKLSVYCGYAKGDKLTNEKYEPCKEAWNNICNFLGFEDNIKIEED